MDAALLFKDRPFDSHLVWMGDLNADLLPVTAGDPWEELPYRAEHHREQREALYSIADHFKLIYAEVSGPVNGQPPSIFAECIFQSPFGRVPQCEQTGVPSLVDQVWASEHSGVQNSYLDWDDAPSDHSWFSCRLPQVPVMTPARSHRRSTWRPVSEEDFQIHVSNQSEGVRNGLLQFLGT